MGVCRGQAAVPLHSWWPARCCVCVRCPWAPRVLALHHTMLHCPGSCYLWLLSQGIWAHHSSPHRSCSFFQMLHLIKDNTASFLSPELRKPQSNSPFLSASHFVKASGWFMQRLGMSGCPGDSMPNITYCCGRVIVIGPLSYWKKLVSPKAFPSVVRWNAEKFWLMIFELVLGRSGRKSSVLKFLGVIRNNRWLWADSDLESTITC